MDQVICPRCGSANDAGKNFCGNCGAPLAASSGPQGNYAPPPPGGYYQQPPQGGYYQQPPINMELKSKIAGGILGILIGTLGIHNFYLGYTNKAIAQLLMTLLSCGILSPVTYIWGLIEGIMILTGSINVDGDGKPLRE